MGFYSIYKIIKDIIRTLFGNKFLKIFIILLILFIIVFLYNEKTYCAFDNLDNFTISTTENNSIILHNRRSITNTTTLETSAFPTQFIYDGWLIYKPYWTSSYYIYNFDTSTTVFTVQDNAHFVPLYKDGSGISSCLRCTYSNGSFSSVSTNNGNNLTGDMDAYRDNYYCSNTDIVNRSNYVPTSTIYFDQTFYSYSYINPTLGISQSDLENLNFSNFIINANSYTEEIENNDGTLYMLFYNKSLDKTTVDYLYPIKEKGFTKGSIYTDYESSTNDNMVFSFPLFMSGVFFNVGSTYQIRFAKQNYNAEYNIMTYEYLGEPYTFTISSNVTQDYINQLNQQTASSSDSESTQQLQNSINEQTQSINDINNSISDSSVDNSSINLPTDNTNDPTQTGVDNIFQTIYNSFTSGTPQDIVFPIPFTNKNITLQPNYIHDMLQNNGASWIINIIQAFWWYIISRFIITDIMKKIRKIKQGNFDNIQNSNIKEDML